MKSYYRLMAEEKGIINKRFYFEVGESVRSMEVETVIDFIENSPENIQSKIKDTMSQIDYEYGDLMNYIVFIAQGMVEFYKY